MTTRHHHASHHRRTPAPPKRLVAEGVPPDEVRRVDLRLAQLGRGAGAMRLGVGEGLLRLDVVGGFQGLGFPTLESYAREALGRSGRWAADVRSLARRLANLPLLRAALAAGELTTSMAELVARVASPEDEAEWLAAAQHTTVRQMRARVAEARGMAAGSDDESDKSPRVTIMTTVDRIDAWAFEQARAMVESVGAGKGDAAIEAMLAEGLTEIIARYPDVELPDGLAASVDEGASAWKAELARMREEGEVTCEPGILAEPVTVETMATEWPDDAIGIDRTLRALAHDIATRDLELAHLGRRAFEAQMWLKLGYASFEQYCRERIGLAASSVHGRLALARNVAALPDIEEAIASGRIGYEAGVLVARVASTQTVNAWLERAAERTVKQLREEVECVAMFARVGGRPLRGEPPPDVDMMADAAMLEREVIALVTGQDREPPTSHSDVRAEEVEDAQDVEVTTTTLRLPMSEDTARYWRALEKVHARLWIEGSFVAFLVCAVMNAWRGAVPKRVAYGDVYLRDRWRCASPICTSKNVTPHHITFRSQGGGEERGNLLSLCERCHLDLVHGGHLTVVGDAELELTFRALGWSCIVNNTNRP